jgi:hypothetical protein
MSTTTPTTINYSPLPLLGNNNLLLKFQTSFSYKVYLAAGIILIGTMLSGWWWYIDSNNNIDESCVGGCLKDTRAWDKTSIEDGLNLQGPGNEFPEAQFFKDHRLENPNGSGNNKFLTNEELQDEELDEIDVDLNVQQQQQDSTTKPEKHILTPNTAIFDPSSPLTDFVPLSADSIAWEVYSSKTNITLRSDFLHDWNYPNDLSQRNISTSSGIHVITTFFHGTYHNRRFKELLAVLVSNLENPHIDALHVLWQGADPRAFLSPSVSNRLWKTRIGRKLVLQQVFVQPTYRVFFTYMNKNLKRGSIAVVTNADIYFDGSIGCVIPPGPGKLAVTDATRRRLVLALSRRHSPLCGSKPEHQNIYDLCGTYVLSHDAFVVAPPISKSVVLNTDHTQNAGYGAENIVIYEFKHAYYQVSNPCWVVKGFHLHCSYERHYAHKQINKYPPRPGMAEPTKKRKCLTTALQVW